MSTAFLWISNGQEEFEVKSTISIMLASQNEIVSYKSKKKKMSKISKGKQQKILWWRN